MAEQNCLFDGGWEAKEYDRGPEARVRNQISIPRLYLHCSGDTTQPCTLTVLCADPQPMLLQYGIITAAWYNIWNLKCRNRANKWIVNLRRFVSKKYIDMDSSSMKNKTKQTNLNITNFCRSKISATIVYHYTSLKMAIIQRQKIMFGKNIEERDL